MDILNGLVSALTNDQPGHLPRVLIGLSITVGLIYYFKGRFWALLYFATIPFLNWSFGIIDPKCPGWSFVGAETSPFKMSIMS